MPHAMVKSGDFKSKSMVYSDHKQFNKVSHVTMQSAVQWYNSPVFDLISSWEKNKIALDIILSIFNLVT